MDKNNKNRENILTSAKCFGQKRRSNLKLQLLLNGDTLAILLLDQSSVETVKKCPIFQTLCPYLKCLKHSKSLPLKSWNVWFWDLVKTPENSTFCLMNGLDFKRGLKTGLFCPDFRRLDQSLSFNYSFETQTLKVSIQINLDSSVR